MADVERRRIRGESPFEEPIGFSRAIRVGDRVLVSGTGPVWPSGDCDPDPGAQARRCFELIERALSDAGASLADVVRIRMFIVDRGDSEAVGAAHAAAMKAARPAATMVIVAGLLDPRWRVEIEAEATIRPDLL
jgi:enamine deaminase RidA (YjgF/YER057c/UK114 family)